MPLQDNFFCLKFFKCLFTFQISFSVQKGYVYLLAKRSFWIRIRNTVVANIGFFYAKRKKLLTPAYVWLFFEEINKIV